MAGEGTDEGIEQAAQEAEAQLDDLEHHSDELGEDIDHTRRDWERRKEDSQVPGAEPDRDAPDEGDDAGDRQGEGPAADEAGQ